LGRRSGSRSGSGAAGHGATRGQLPDPLDAPQFRPGCRASGNRPCTVGRPPPTFACGGRGVYHRAARKSPNCVRKRGLRASSCRGAGGARIAGAPKKAPSPSTRSPADSPRTEPGGSLNVGARMPPGGNAGVIKWQRLGQASVAVEGAGYAQWWDDLDAAGQRAERTHHGRAATRRIHWITFIREGYSCLRSRDFQGFR
jgi:hypothetical protein